MRCTEKYEFDKSPRTIWMSCKIFSIKLEGVGSVSVCYIIEMFEGDASIMELNKPFITLIPKCKDLESMTDFRPINLCNVVYKIISKVLVNRIKPFINSFVRENLSAFVSNRLITDNIIIASDIFHWLNSGNRSKKDAFTSRLT